DHPGPSHAGRRPRGGPRERRAAPALRGPRLAAARRRRRRLRRRRRGAGASRPGATGAAAPGRAARAARLHRPDLRRVDPGVRPAAHVRHPRLAGRDRRRGDAAGRGARRAGPDVVRAGPAGGARDRRGRRGGRRRGGHPAPRRGERPAPAGAVRGAVGGAARRHRPGRLRPGCGRLAGAADGRRERPRRPLGHAAAQLTGRELRPERRAGRPPHRRGGARRRRGRPGPGARARRPAPGGERPGWVRRLADDHHLQPADLPRGPAAAGGPAAPADLRGRRGAVPAADDARPLRRGPGVVGLRAVRRHRRGRRAGGGPGTGGPDDRDRLGRGHGRPGPPARWSVAPGSRRALGRRDRRAVAVGRRGRDRLLDPDLRPRGRRAVHRQLHPGAARRRAAAPPPARAEGDRRGLRRGAGAVAGGAAGPGAGHRRCADGLRPGRGAAGLLPRHRLRLLRADVRAADRRPRRTDGVPAGEAGLLRAVRVGHGRARARAGHPGPGRGRLHVRDRGGRQLPRDHAAGARLARGVVPGRRVGALRAHPSQRRRDGRRAGLHGPAGRRGARPDDERRPVRRPGCAAARQQLGAGGDRSRPGRGAHGRQRRRGRRGPVPVVARGACDAAGVGRAGTARGGPPAPAVEVTGCADGVGVGDRRRRRPRPPVATRRLPPGSGGPPDGGTSPARGRGAGARPDRGRRRTGSLRAFRGTGGRRRPAPGRRAGAQRAARRSGPPGPLAGPAGSRLGAGLRQQPERHSRRRRAGPGRRADQRGRRPAAPPAYGRRPQL
ncbi:MAG: FIG001454: Transglutaminase-like enzymes, putative cysteine proteases, partial [uncultured Frankineae bacterium]